MNNQVTTKQNKRYPSVDGMLRGIGMDTDFVESFEAQVEAEQLTAQLQRLRLQKGMTQRQLADRLGITQGAVSKIEHKADDDLTLKEIGSYMSACSSTLHLTIGRPLIRAEQIKRHAFEIRRLLDELSDTAGEDGEIKKGVQDFWLEVVVNLTSLLSRSKAVPHEKIAEMFSERGQSSEPQRVKDLEYTLPEELAGV